MPDDPDPDPGEEIDLAELDAFRQASTPRIPTGAVVWLLNGLAERIRAGAASPELVAGVLEGAAEKLRENALDALAASPTPSDPEH